MVLSHDNDRRILPRWRDSTVTRKTRELHSLSIGKTQVIRDSESLEARAAEWAANESVAVASDFLSVAFVLDEGRRAREAARFISEHENQAGLAAKIATKILIDDIDPYLSEEDAPSVEEESLRSQIAIARGRLRLFPRNSIGWVDLARYYSLLGQNRSAEGAARVATSSDPGNRFVVRSVSRLLVHHKEPDRAHSLYRNQAQVRTDPWLMSAEIAISTILGESSRNLKTARKLLKSRNHSDSELSELACAVATVEMLGGSDRAARRLFKLGLEDPTDNAVAQADWASRRMTGVNIEAKHLNTPRSFEARAWDAHQAGNWISAFSNYVRWYRDEPFSSRPAIHGTYIASVALEDYSSAIRLARSALLSSPDSQILRNNLTFALASSGQVREARIEFGKMDQSRFTPEDEVARLATDGLLKFREGRPDEGRELYLRALEKSTGPEFAQVRMLAAIFLHREEHRAGTAHDAESLERAIEASYAYKDPTSDHLRNQAERRH